MLSGESYLIDASWVFFAAWTVALVVLNAIAFGGELLTKLRPTSDTPTRFDSAPGKPVSR